MHGLDAVLRRVLRLRIELLQEIGVIERVIELAAAVVVVVVVADVAMVGQTAAVEAKGGGHLLG